MSTNTLSFILLLPIHVILCCFSMSQINFALFCVMKFNQYRVHVNPFRSDANISLSCTNRFSAAVPEPELVSKFLKRQQHCWNGTERMECCCAIADLERYFYWFYLFSCFFFYRWVSGVKLEWTFFYGAIESWLFVFFLVTAFRSVKWSFA